MRLATQAGLLFVVLCVVQVWLNHHVPEPYMDEFFHTRQTRRYCSADFGTWDPKITTLPGTYLIALVLLYVTSSVVWVVLWALRPMFWLALTYGWIGRLHPFLKSAHFELEFLLKEFLCTATFLRFVNVVVFVFIYFTMHEVYGRMRFLFVPRVYSQDIQPSVSKLTQFVQVAKTIFPPYVLFFVFLFYTDVTGLFCVVRAISHACTALLRLKVHITYRTDTLSLGSSVWLTVMWGTLAVLCRQTNIVWCVFLWGFMLICQYLWERECDVVERFRKSIADTEPDETKQSSLQQDKRDLASQEDASGSTIRRRGANATADHAHNSSNTGTTATTVDYDPAPEGLTRYTVGFLRFALKTLVPSHPTFLQVTLPFTLLVCAFLAFLGWNGGVVVGDKSNHQVSLHWAQLCYVVPVLASSFGLSALTAPLRSLYSVSWLVMFAVMWVCADYGKVAHPFLLADNRHYTFYLWARVLSQPSLWLRLGLCSLYTYCGMTLKTMFVRPRRMLSICVAEMNLSLHLLFMWACFCTVLVLVASPLLEFRYFIVPVAIFHLICAPMRRIYGELVREPAASVVPDVLWVLAYIAVTGVMLYMFVYMPFPGDFGHLARFMW